MDIGSIDYWANNKVSYLHRAAPVAKVAATLMVIVSILIARDWPLLLAIYLFLAAGVVAAKLPLLRVLAIGAYPAIFAGLFVISAWDGTFNTPAVILLKAMSAALASILLITTTPYPEVFGALRPFLPRVINDGLLLTYRSIFILLEQVSNLLQALRLRGGLGGAPALRRPGVLASAIGVTLIYALGLAERQYSVMKLRGYESSIATGHYWHRLQWSDSVLLTVCAGLVAISALVTLAR